MTEPSMIPEPRPELRVVACPRPFSVARTELTLAEGPTVAELLERVGIDPLRAAARVFIDDTFVPKRWWARVHPKAGRTVTVRVIPTGGGGSKDVLRVVALIAIVAVSVFLVQPELAAVLAALDLGLSTSAIAGIAGIGAGLFTIGNSLSVNGLLPPRGSSSDGEHAT